MKRIIIVFLCLIILSTSCTGCYPSPQQSIAVLDIEKISHTDCPIKPHFITPKIEDTKFISEIWKNGEWETGATKDAYDFRFEAEGKIIRYVSAEGLFNDLDFDQKLQLTEEQRLAINEYLFCAFELNKE